MDQAARPPAADTTTPGAAYLPACTTAIWLVSLHALEHVGCAGAGDWLALPGWRRTAIAWKGSNITDAIMIRVWKPGGSLSPSMQTTRRKGMIEIQAHAEAELHALCPSSGESYLSHKRTVCQMQQSLAGKAGEARARFSRSLRAKCNSAKSRLVLPPLCDPLSCFLRILLCCHRRILQATAAVCLCNHLTTLKGQCTSTHPVLNISVSVLHGDSPERGGRGQEATARLEHTPQAESCWSMSCSPSAWRRWQTQTSPCRRLCRCWQQRDRRLQAPQHRPAQWRRWDRLHDDTGISYTLLSTAGRALTFFLSEGIACIVHMQQMLAWWLCLARSGAARDVGIRVAGAKLTRSLGGHRRDGQRWRGSWAGCLRC